MEIVFAVIIGLALGALLGRWVAQRAGIAPDAEALAERVRAAIPLLLASLPPRALAALIARARAAAAAAAAASSSGEDEDAASAEDKDAAAAGFAPAAEAVSMAVAAGGPAAPALAR